MRAAGKSRELVGFGLALAILVGVAGLAYRSVDGAVDTLGWVEHAEQVLAQMDAVSAAYARAASARRAFVIAGDASQLDELPELDARVTHAVETVRASLADNPVQVKRLDHFAELVGKRLSTLDGAVAERRLTGSGAETAQGLALTAKVRTSREEIEAEENRLLAERDALTRRDLARTKLAEVMGTLASVAILLFAFRRLLGEIDRRRRTEQALLSSEKFLDSVFEHIPDMIFVKEAGELRFERINRAGEELLGVARADLIHKNDFDFFPREQAEAFVAKDTETLGKRLTVEVVEEPIQTKAGERWLHTKKVPILDEAGVPRYLLGISEDITESRQAAEALRMAKDAAESANKELEAFSYSVAHDLRAPLRAIDGFSLALQEDCGDKLDADGKGYLARVRAAAVQMSRLIDGLLGLSRLTRSEMVRETVDLTQLARQAGERLREAQPERDVELSVGDGLVAQGDPRLLGAAVDNLLGNAWKFTGKSEKPHIEVGRETKDGAQVFFVRDNGAGFEQAYVHKLFGAFQRLHGAGEFEGSGIGLATVQRIVRRHGGKIWAEGAVGQGATFYFTL